jgi:hypothetical protein
MRSIIILLAVLLVGTPACQSPPAAGRYLYAISCDARVGKFDTLAQQKLNDYDLAERTGKEQIIPRGKGTLDVCLANDLAYDADTFIFYVLAPLQARLKPDGTMDYRVLGFSVPGLQLVKNLPGGDSLSIPPHLQIGPAGAVKAVKDSEWSPLTDLDLSSFAPDGKRLPNQILEVSGDAVLLRLFTANQNELSLAVAHRQSKTLVRLQDLIATAAPNVHLAPGGSEVLVEDTGSGPKVVKSGKFSIYSAKTGRLIKTYSDPRVKDLYFLAISPTGKVIYSSMDNYWFQDLGRTYPADAVMRPFSSARPGLFFAGQ